MISSSVELEFESSNRYWPTDEFVSFTTQNEQLKKLYVDAFHCRDEYNLKNVDELRIKTLVFDHFVPGIVGKKDLSKLHTLRDGRVLGWH